MLFLLWLFSIDFRACLLVGFGVLLSHWTLFFFSLDRLWFLIALPLSLENCLVSVVLFFRHPCTLYVGASVFFRPVFLLMSLLSSVFESLTGVYAHGVCMSADVHLGLVWSLLYPRCCVFYGVPCLSFLFFSFIVVSCHRVVFCFPFPIISGIRQVLSLFS